MARHGVALTGAHRANQAALHHSRSARTSPDFDAPRSADAQPRTKPPIHTTAKARHIAALYPALSGYPTPAYKRRDFRWSADYSKRAD